MACYWLYINETSISIPNFTERDGITYYNIEVIVGDVKWFIRRRYNDFFELHQQLINDHGISKDQLPPKKVILNKSKTFIETRREALQTYLQNILQYFKRAMPKEFWEFLDFHQYEIYFLLQNMAACCFSDYSEHELTPLQLHAVSECLKQPYLELDQMGKVCDFSNILDYFSQLIHLKIEGSGLNYKESNIIPNNLPFELSSFKNLKKLTLFDANLDNIYSLDNLRNTLTKLEVHRTQVTKISKILQCDSVHKSVIDEKQIWKNLVEVDFSCNTLMEIDAAIQLVPVLEVLNLSNNKLSSFPDLSCLTNLKILNLSQNMITECKDLHTKLGNIGEIDLSQNRVTTLQGFSKLYSLESLNVSHNNICYIEDAKPVGNLPCLENIVLNGNPVAATVDYRVKILENFEDRAKEIFLDNEKATHSELDKASVLRALKLAKDKNRLSKTE